MLPPLCVLIALLQTSSSSIRMMRTSASARFQNALKENQEVDQFCLDLSITRISGAMRLRVTYVCCARESSEGRRAARGHIRTTSVERTLALFKGWQRGSDILERVYKDAHLIFGVCLLAPTQESSNL